MHDLRWVVHPIKKQGHSLGGAILPPCEDNATEACLGLMSAGLSGPALYA